MKKQDYNKLVKSICAIEGSKVETSVANVREVFSHTKKIRV